MGKRCGWSFILIWVISLISGKIIMAEEQLISSFETEEDLAKWERTDNVILERSTEHVTEGKYSLKATFLSKGGEGSALTLKYPNYPSKDFSKYEYLAMDVYYDYDELPPEIICIGLEANIGAIGFYNSRGEASPGYVPLETLRGRMKTSKIGCFLGIGGMSDKVKFSFSDIASFSIIMRRPSKDFTVFFDNIRLVPKLPVSEKRTTPIPILLEEAGPLFLKNILPVTVFCRNQESILAVKVSNTNSEYKTLNLEVWLEREKSKVKCLLKETFEIKEKEEKIFNCNFKPDVSEGRYRIGSYLYPSKELWLDVYHEKEKILFSATDEIRVIEESIPFLKRDLNFRVRGDFFAENGVLPLEKLLSIEEEIGLRRSSEFTMEIIGNRLVQLLWYDDQFPWNWEDYTTALHTLYENKIPFVIAPSNFWATREKYEYMAENMGKMVRLGCEIGKDYFVGLRISESEAISHGYTIFTEKETDMEKVDAFVNFIKKFVHDIGLPEDKLLFLDVSCTVPEEWRLACGKNVVVGQAFTPILPIELSYSTLRGMSKSFNQWWEWEICRWPFFSDNPTVPTYFDPKTGRPVNTTQQVPVHFFGLSKGFAGDVHKMYLSSYYNGVKSINAYGENPYDIAEKEAIKKFIEFIRDNPRGEEVISRIAVVKSKGSRWIMPWQIVQYGQTKPQFDVEKERDFLYLNTFFPGFSDDNINPKYWWTGTPYGAVDLIYPQMNLFDMKKYNSLIFLGYNRMDSVRGDFLDDLMTYVKDGGVILLSVDQLRTIQGKIEVKKLSPFLGARIEDNFPLPPQKRLEEYIEVREETPFNLEKKRYLINEEKIRIHTVIPEKAKVIATDSRGTPVLLLNKNGQGYVFLVTTPNLSTIPPAGKSPFVSDIIDKIAKFRPLPISISPVRDDVEFLISKAKDKEATIFIMNHGEKDWSGDIIVNLKTASISSEIANNIRVKVGTGYDVKEVSPEIKKDGDNLIISGITLSGDSEDFISYRQASFALVRLGGER